METYLLAEHPHCVPEIAQWYFDEWESLSPNGCFDRVLQSVTGESKNSEHFPLAFVAFKNGVLAGVVELKLREQKKHPEYEHWLGGMYVKADFRGQGVARALITRAITHAQHLKITELYLNSEDKNIPLYNLFGFHSLHKTEKGTTIMVRSENV